MKSAQGYSRVDRVAAQLQRELGDILLRSIRDPRLNAINLTHVKGTKDLSIARVYYVLLSDDVRPDKSLEKALSRAVSFMRRELGQRLSLRIVPKLEFFFDDAVEHGRRMEEVFAELELEREAEADGAEGGAATDADET